MAVNRNTLTNKVLGDGSFDNGSFVSKGLAVNPKTGKDFTSDTSTPASMKYNPTEAKKIMEGRPQRNRHFQSAYHVVSR